jgi:alkylation response protein AidB-like acyl-CoA dehydrogenase
MVSATAAEVARDAGSLADPRMRDLIGEARVLEVAGRELQQRIGSAVRTGRITDQAAAVARLFLGVANARARTISYELAGAAGGAWTEEDGAAEGRGVEFLMRQATCIGGGTTEMARNVISERVLGMPRERATDREVPFREVPRGPSANSRGT